MVEKKTLEGTVRKEAKRRKRDAGKRENARKRGRRRYGARRGNGKTTEVEGERAEEGE